MKRLTPNLALSTLLSSMALSSVAFAEDTSVENSDGTVTLAMATTASSLVLESATSDMSEVSENTGEESSASEEPTDVTPEPISEEQEGNSNNEDPIEVAPESISDEQDESNNHDAWDDSSAHVGDDEETEPFDAIPDNGGGANDEEVGDATSGKENTGEESSASEEPTDATPEPISEEQAGNTMPDMTCDADDDDEGCISLGDSEEEIVNTEVGLLDTGIGTDFYRAIHLNGIDQYGVVNPI